MLASTKYLLESCELWLKNAEYTSDNPDNNEFGCFNDLELYYSGIIKYNLMKNISNIDLTETLNGQTINDYVAKICMLLNCEDSLTKCTYTKKSSYNGNNSVSPYLLTLYNMQQIANILNIDIQ